MYTVWWLGSISWAVYVFMYFDMFYIQWHNLTKKDLWYKVHMIMIMMIIMTVWRVKWLQDWIMFSHSTTTKD
jgi:hypothetical protein